MSDVHEEIELWFAMHPTGPCTDERQLLNDAADEIARLTQRLATAEAEVTGLCKSCETIRSQRDKAQALLREAVELHKRLGHLWSGTLVGKNWSERTKEICDA